MREIDLREYLKDDPHGPIIMLLDEDDIVTDMVVLLRVQKLSNTDDQIVFSTTENTGGVVTHGMLTSAVILHSDWMINGKDEND